MSSAERHQADENERRCRERRVPIEGSPARKNCGYHQPEDEDNREDAESSPVQMPSAVNDLQHCIDKIEATPKVTATNRASVVIEGLVMREIAGMSVSSTPGVGRSGQLARSIRSPRPRRRQART